MKKTFTTKGEETVLSMRVQTIKWGPSNSTGQSL